MLRFYRLQQLILAFGDLTLIGLATQLAPFIRLGHMLDVFRVHTAATAFTTSLYLIFFYIFNPQISPRRNRLRISQGRQITPVPSAGATPVKYATLSLT